MRHETFASDSRPLRGSSRRARLSIICEVRQGTRPWKLARLSDLSETGFKLASLTGYDQSRTLRIRIPGIQILDANICWHKGKQIGCAFVSPLHVAVFEHLVRLAGGATA